MSISRRACLSQLLALGFLPALLACAPGKKLVFASHLWPGYEFLFLARDEGWLPLDQVTLLETNNATESIGLLVSGKVVAATLTLDEVLLARSNGVPLTVVMVFDVSAGADKLLVDPKIRHLAELKGKRIGVETSAVGSLMLLKILQAARLTAQDVEVVEMGSSHRETWESGKVDALITYDPTATSLISQGAVPLFDSRQMPEMIFDVLAVRTDVLTSQASEIKAITAGHFRGLTAMRTNPSDTTYRLARHLGVPGHQVMGTYRGLKMPDLQANHTYLEAPDSSLRLAARELSGRALCFFSQATDPVVGRPSGRSWRWWTHCVYSLSA